MLEKKLKITRDNFYYGLRLCQEKGVRLFVQKNEFHFDDEFIVYTDTWATNPNPTISHFFSDVSNEDFLVKLEKAIKLFWEHIRKKKSAGGSNEVS